MALLPGFKAKTLPLFVKTHKFAQNNYLLMTSDVLDKKLNKENQRKYRKICILQNKYK
jgi:hypothetical protein